MKTKLNKVLRGALRKAPKTSYAKLQAAKEETRQRDLKRLVGSQVTAADIRRESQVFTEEEVQSFQLVNFESMLRRPQ